MFAFDKIQITGTPLALVAPTVTTGTVSTVTTSTAAINNSSLTAGGNTNITDYGIAYVVGTGTPTTANSKLQAGTTSPGSFPASFSVNLTGLTPGTQYTARAYATNSAGTAYGSNVTFTTPTTVTSIVRADANPTNVGSVNFTVTFANPVTGVNTNNFGITFTGGFTTFGNVAAVSGSGTTYTVTVNTGVGSGTIKLSMANATGITPGVSGLPYNGGETYDIDKTAPTVAISSSAGTSGSTTATSPIPFTATFSENVSGFVAGDVTVTNGSVTGGVVNGTSPGTTYTFTVTPTTPGTATTVTVPGNVVQDAAGNFNTAAPASYSLTYTPPTTTVASVTRLTPSPTATAQVRYRVVFANSVTGITISNFSLTTSGLASTGISSASGSGATYTVTVNTSTGTGTLRLNVQNSTGISPTVTNVPYTSGEQYSIIKSFPAAPLLTLRGTGSVSGSFGDVSAFVDQVQVVQSGTSTTVAGGLQNSSFEDSNVPAAAVSLAAGVAQDANNTLNTASNAYSVTYIQPITPTPIVTIPSNGSTTNSTPTSVGSAVVGSTVRVYIDGVQVGAAVTANSGGTWIRTFSGLPALTSGTHTVYATAQLPDPLLSAPSPTNTFTVQVPATYTSSSAAQASTARVVAGSTNQAILQVAIVIGGGPDAPLSATSFTFTTTGSTAPADISAARVYYTGTSSSFATTNQFGSAQANPNGTFTIGGPGSWSTAPTTSGWRTTYRPPRRTATSLTPPRRASRSSTARSRAPGTPPPRPRPAAAQSCGAPAWRAPRCASVAMPRRATWTSAPARTRPYC